MTKPEGTSEAIVLVGHGSPRERSNEQVRSLAVALEERLTVPVAVGFLECATPSISAAIEGLVPSVTAITVVPLALFGASHVKADVPLAVEQARDAHPAVTFSMGGPIGVHPAVVELVNDRVRATERELGVDRSTDSVAVVLCARGSSDPDANADATKIARLLFEGRSFAQVQTAFVGITDPDLPTGLHATAKLRPDAVVVVPYMLGDGVLTQRVHDQTDAFDREYPYLSAGSTAPLGTADRLLDVLADRYRQARTDSVEMSCDTCKYKVDLDGFTAAVGGARATFRAIAHQTEHADRSGTDGHAHDVPDHHVTVCTGRSCTNSDGAAVLERLRQSVRDSQSCTARVARTSCLGQCGDGPMVAVYPDGIWYGGISPADTERIVSSHLDRDRILTDRVHTVLNT